MTQPFLAHAAPVSQVLDQFDVDPQVGLSVSEVRTRTQEYGLNQLPDSGGQSILTIFWHQCSSLIVGIMVAAVLMSAAFNHWVDASVILGILIVNIMIGFVQEYQAESAIQALRELVVTKVDTRREGMLHQCDPSELVPGDIILLKEGDKIPADARVLVSRHAQTIESSLTGESLPVEKSPEPVAAEAVVGDQTSLVFMGTMVARGSLEAVVVATGFDTRLGQVAMDLEEVVEQPTHYEKMTQRLSKQMAVLALGLATITFVVGYFVRDFGLYDMIVFTIATLISALPESLPIILIIVLTLGAKQMAKRQALVRHLSATETLGVVSVIVTDKTGTLTQNVMQARGLAFPDQKNIEITRVGSEQPDNTIGESQTQLFQNGKPLIFDQHPQLEKLITIAGLCSGVRANTLATSAVAHLSGDPTEKALYQLAQELGFFAEADRKLPVVHDDLPFIQDLKLRASLLSVAGDKAHSHELVVIGAPETVIDRCTHVLTSDGVKELGSREKVTFQKQYGMLTDQAMRVLACAYRPHTSKSKQIEVEDLDKLILVGCVGLLDPPRPEVAAAIARAHKAGIKVIMATGDHPQTARAIAEEIGLVSSKGITAVLTEQDIGKLSDAELAKALGTVRVLARLSPTTKRRVAQVLQSKGAIVAMTGDGVNDAPALKQADVGIAMGVVGTDVAREASDIILADDNFSSIVNAIEVGRTQFGNVRRTSYFLIATNVAESLSLLITLLIGYPLPLLPIQILWLNIVGGGVTDVALATEPSHGDVLSVPPRSAKEPILIKNFVPLFSVIVLSMVVVVLGVFAWFLPSGVDKARTAAFTVLTLSQLCNMFTMRSLHHSVFKIGLWSNTAVTGVTGLALVLLGAALYAPPLQTLFMFVPLSPSEFGLVAAIALGVFIAGEVTKLVAPAGTKYR